MADADPSEPPQQASTRSITVHGPAETGADADVAWLRERLDRVACELGHPVGRIDVAIVSDDEMARLHERHRGVAGPTDVLTFQVSPAGAPVEADIAVCVDVARRCAAERSHAVRQELLLYAVHGILHCAGFDDDTEDACRVMHAEEDRILTAVGVGVTFSNRDPGSTPS